jgi:hypothetical protein
MSDCLHCDIHEMLERPAKRTSRSGGNRGAGYRSTRRPNLDGSSWRTDRVMAGVLANLGGRCWSPIRPTHAVRAIDGCGNRSFENALTALDNVSCCDQMLIDRFI